MIRTLIVDDEPLPRERVRSLLAARPEIDVIGECADGRSAVSAILRERPDLVFLDVQMPELSGFDVIQKISGEYVPAVVFITAFDDYALQAFDVNAVDYVLKPIQPDRFERALAKALEKLRSEPKRFVVSSGSKYSFVNASDIDWIDAADNYVRLHVGGREHLMRETLKSVEGQLRADKFVRVHRSAIVNLEKLKSVEPHAHGEYVLTMIDGTRLTSSRSYSDRLRTLLH
jgi:two-component system LytT family response regulator